jgi:hypothetical protein
MASTKDVLDHHLKCFGEGATSRAFYLTMLGRIDCRQRVQDGHRHVRRAGWQDRGPVIHRQDSPKG